MKFFSNVENERELQSANFKSVIDEGIEIVKHRPHYMNSISKNMIMEEGILMRFDTEYYIQDSLYILRNCNLITWWGMFLLNNLVIFFVIRKNIAINLYNNKFLSAFFMGTDERHIYLLEKLLLQSSLFNYSEQFPLIVLVYHFKWHRCVVKYGILSCVIIN